MPDTPITWSAFAAALGAASVILGGLWVVHNAIKEQFERTRRESETRAVRTHERIDNLSAEIKETYLPREVFEAERRRYDDALHERDRQMADLNARLTCPGAGRV